MGEAVAATTPPAVGDITGRRAMWEPILAAASAALPVPVAGPAAVFFHGGGYIFGCATRSGRSTTRKEPRAELLLRPLGH